MHNCALIFRKQDKRRVQIAVTLQFSTLSESFAKWDTHLRERKKVAILTTFQESGTRNRNRTCNYPLGVFIGVRAYLCLGNFLAK